MNENTTDEVVDDRARAIGERIRQARNELGVTQKELADLVHVTSRAVTDWETGKVTPWARMSDLAAILEKPAPWLRCEEDLDSSEVRKLLEQVLASQRDLVDQVKLLRFDLQRRDEIPH
jgi:transcriptional regulator with XRE-family HTH domain